MGIYVPNILTISNHIVAYGCLWLYCQQFKQMKYLIPKWHNRQYVLQYTRYSCVDPIIEVAKLPFIFLLGTTRTEGISTDLPTLSQIGPGNIQWCWPHHLLNLEEEKLWVNNIYQYSALTRIHKNKLRTTLFLFKYIL